MNINHSNPLISNAVHAEYLYQDYFYPSRCQSGRLRRFSQVPESTCRERSVQIPSPSDYTGSVDIDRLEADALLGKDNEVKRLQDVDGGLFHVVSECVETLLELLWRLTSGLFEEAL